jgi:hypothetical protein
MEHLADTNILIRTIHGTHAMQPGATGFCSTSVFPWL